jgi:hypothetical protein
VTKPVNQTEASFQQLTSKKKQRATLFLSISYLATDTTLSRSIDRPPGHFQWRSYTLSSLAYGPSKPTLTDTPPLSSPHDASRPVVTRRHSPPLLSQEDSLLLSCHPPSHRAPILISRKRYLPAQPSLKAASSVVVLTTLLHHQQLYAPPLPCRYSP